MVRNIISPNAFDEIFVYTPIEVAKKRDVKWLCAEARLGQATNTTGTDRPYKNPNSPTKQLENTNVLLNNQLNSI